MLLLNSSANNTPAVQSSCEGCHVSFVPAFTPIGVTLCDECGAEMQAEMHRLESLRAATEDHAGDVARCEAAARHHARRASKRKPFHPSHNRRQNRRELQAANNYRRTGDASQLTKFAHHNRDRLNRWDRAFTGYLATPRV